MADYEKALKRPFQDIKKLIIGCVFAIVPFVDFIYMGYIAKATKNTLNKNNELPEWKEWIDLFMKGLTIFVIEMLYFIPVGIFLFVGVETAILKAVTSKDLLGSYSLIASGGIIDIVGVSLLLFTGFFIPMAIIRYIDKENIKSAFDFREIFKKVFTGNYILAWILMFVYSIALLQLLLFIPIIGTTKVTIIIGVATATFITRLTLMTVFAEIYNGKK